MQDEGAEIPKVDDEIPKVGEEIPKVGDELWELNDSESNEVIQTVINVEDAEATFCYKNISKEPDCEPTNEGGCFKCGVCEYQAKTKHELRYHEDETHNWCWVCDKQFETKREFKVHHYTVHSSSKSIWD